MRARFVAPLPPQHAMEGSDVTVALRSRTDEIPGNQGLRNAVHRHSAASSSGMLERLFTFAFKGLVYPQIWEDPEVDLEALAINPDSRVVTIASGGCNVLSYLSADPASVSAVDLNRTHVSLTKLKLAALTALPNYQAFHRFFGRADDKANVGVYDIHLRDALDSSTRAYWEKRDLAGRRRIEVFTRNFYRYGLLGRFIGAGHLLSRLYGVDPKGILAADTLDAQRLFFKGRIKPIFEKRFVRWITSKPVSLYGLGIPPAQFEALALSGGGDMARVLCNRLERLACGFPLSENYFAWQAFGRRYPEAGQGALPRYLDPAHYDAIRGRADRVTVENISFTEYLGEHADQSLDRYVLLDAQDWMTDVQLTDLWSEITRTARPGARVVFRTAAEPSLLPGRVPAGILDRWTYEQELSLTLTARDRSSIYGGVHVYALEEKS